MAIAGESDFCITFKQTDVHLLTFDRDAERYEPRPAASGTLSVVYKISQPLQDQRLVLTDGNVTHHFRIGPPHRAAQGLLVTIIRPNRDRFGWFFSVKVRHTAGGFEHPFRGVLVIRADRNQILTVYDRFVEAVRNSDTRFELVSD